MSRASYFANQNHFGVPDPLEVQQIKEALKQYVKRDDTVLVLGATAELRSIALELGCKVVSVDITMEMITAREGNVSVKDPTRDVAVRGNWLNLWFLPRHCFAAVLADASFNNITRAQQGSLFKECAGLLRKDGILVFRQMYWYKEKPIQDVIQLYKKKKISMREMMLCLFFHRDLPRACKDNTVSVRESFKSILRILQKAKIEKALLDYIKRYNWDNPYLIADQADFEKRLQKIFYIESVYVSKKLCHSRCAPIYLALKR
ncbi:class I SAM-dependent methyltransferase [Candidatus Woesearchaeota archaeon]|nr:class I SAM-dependent methyltransferase [Candidatus Woesearchaeota archaeon]